MRVAREVLREFEDISWTVKVRKERGFYPTVFQVEVNGLKLEKLDELRAGEGFDREELIKVFRKWIERLGIKMDIEKMEHFIWCYSCNDCRAEFGKLCEKVKIPCPVNEWKNEKRWGAGKAYPCCIRNLMFGITCSRREMAFWIGDEDRKKVVKRIRRVIDAALQSRMEVTIEKIQRAFNSSPFQESYTTRFSLNGALPASEEEERGEEEKAKEEITFV